MRLDCLTFQSLMTSGIFLAALIAQGSAFAVATGRPSLPGATLGKGEDPATPRIENWPKDLSSLTRYQSAIAALSTQECRRRHDAGEADGTYCLAERDKYGEKEFEYEAARRGHVLAQNNRGLRLAKDETAEAHAEARELMQQAADGGVPNAMVTMGWWRMKGIAGMEIDYAEAMRWNLEGFRLGHSEGANNIGELYEKGLGVPADPRKAAVWYNRAARMGNPEATEQLIRLRRTVFYGTVLDDIED